MPVDITRFTVPELLKHISDLPASKRVGALKEIANLKPDLKSVLQLCYHKNVVFDLPEGSPPYTPLNVPENWGYNRLPKELKKVHYFLKGAQNNLTSFRKEKLFIDILESVSPDEAKLFIMIKDKKLTYKGFNRKLVEDALPELFAGETQN
jgi:hypothetical protein